MSASNVERPSSRTLFPCDVEAIVDIRSSWEEAVRGGKARIPDVAMSDNLLVTRPCERGRLICHQLIKLQAPGRLNDRRIPMGMQP